MAAGVNSSVLLDFRNNQESVCGPRSVEKTVPYILLSLVHHLQSAWQPWAVTYVGYLYMDNPAVTCYQGSTQYLQHSLVGIVCDVMILRKSLHVSMLPETLKFDRVSHGLTGFWGEMIYMPEHDHCRLSSRQKIWNASSLAHSMYARHMP